MATHRKAGSYVGLETLGRVRLSRHFFMRDFLYSEISNYFGRPNMPDDPQLAIAAGTALCTTLLDPLVDTFGPIAIRSAFRSAELNHFGATDVTPQKCSGNEANRAGHIWDLRDRKGRMGATACIAIPWFADQADRGRDWRDLAWWVHDHLPFSEMEFYPKLAAFNLTWREEPERTISSYAVPKGKLLKAGAEPALDRADRQALYSDFPPFCGIVYPAVPEWSA